MALYDVVQANRQATATGTALGQAMFSNSLRMQQLKSEQALQQLQQQQAAEMLSWTIRQHHMAIDQEAENAKRASVFQSMITPTLSMPANDMTEFAPMIGPDGQPMAKPTVTNGMTQVPNPAYVPDMGEAYIKAFLPGNPDPAKVITTGGALSLRQAQAKDEAAQAATRGMARPRTPEQIESDKALTAERQAQADLARTRIDEIKKGGHAGADPDWVRSLKFYEERSGKKLSDTEIKDLMDVRMGIKPKAAVVHESEAEYIKSQINKAMDQPFIPTKEGGYRPPLSRQEAIDALRKEHSNLTTAAPQATPQSGGDEVVRILKNGKKAIFNSKSQQFIRYAD